MMHGCASVSEAPRRRTHSVVRHESHAAARATATSNRHRRSVMCGSSRKPIRFLSVDGDWISIRTFRSRRTHDDTLRHHAVVHQPPQGDQQLAGERHDHGFA